MVKLYSISWTLMLAIIAGGLVVGYVLISQPTGRPEHTRGSQSTQPIARLVRIKEAEYRQSIIDVFGPVVNQGGGLIESRRRVDGLLAVGDAEVSVTSAGFEAAEAAAQFIAEQVVSEAHRQTLIPCRPATITAPDDACARAFLATTGRLLFRRALSDAEVAMYVQHARQAALQAGDFYAGLATSLAAMLIAPEFLFRIEQAEEPLSQADRTEYRLTAYSRAAHLSAFLWNSVPDNELLSAAEDGKLESDKEMEFQIDRMLRSSKLENGVRAFFSDMLEFDKFEILGKDPLIYPRFTPRVAEDIEEQALRLLVNHLITRRADYREIFTTRHTFLTPSLAALLDIIVPRGNIQNGAPDQWVRYQYSENDPRAGFLALPAFTALHSHPGKSSPTLRGKAIRESLLCQDVPDPPSQVDFALFNSGAAGPTVRDRLEAHNEVPACAGCHNIMDPLGYALEHFDGAGSWRATEGGHRIDTTGKLDGVAFEDGRGLAEAISESPTAVSCVVNRVYSYGLGRPLRADDRRSTERFRRDFARSGYLFPELLRIVASAPQFYEIEGRESHVMQSAARSVSSAGLGDRL